MPSSKHHHDDLHKHHDHHHQHHPHAGHHHAAPDSNSRAFILAIILNIGFVAIEFAYGFVANSTALMADAGHNLSDVLGLLLAWGAAVLAKTQPAGRYTYGLRSTSILAALGNSMLLLVACGAIALEALRRFQQPTEIPGLTVSLVAAAGIVVNGFSAWLFMAGSKHDLNIRGAYLHMMADAAVSLGVVLAGVAMLFTGWYWLDPALSLVIVAVIMIGTWGLLREALRLSLSAVPAHIDLDAVQRYLASQSGVTDVHDLHIWGMSTTESALTAHLVMPGGYPGDAFMDHVAQQLREHFAIHHCTLQIARSTSRSRCALVS
ncbi:MAG: cation diffusion facilitator family transporter [Herminiimonas sp.]|nr:cation diffusion facilitator family transporter [Herminiimonas sp.]